MLNRGKYKLSKTKCYAAIILTYAGLFSSEAMAQTAGDVMTKMSVNERGRYFAGVVEGLAYARWLRDRPDETGFKCVYDWYYEGGEENHRRIDAWLNRHPDKPIGPLFHVLIKRKCGE